LIAEEKRVYKMEYYAKKKMLESIGELRKE